MKQEDQEMRFVRGLDKNAQTKLSDYSIREIRFLYDTVEYCVPPDKTWLKRFRPCLAIELEGRRRHGVRMVRHPARLVLDADEIEQVVATLRDKLLEGFHTLVENDLFDEIAKAENRVAAR
jgi:hypothetical protein